MTQNSAFGSETATEATRESLRDQGRLVLAFFMLPVLDALVAFLFMLVALPLFAAGHFDLIDSAVSMAFGVGLTAILVTAVLVFPTVMLLMAWGPVSLIRLATAGTVIGVAPYLLVVTLAWRNTGADPMDTATDGFEMAIYGALLGLISAVVFWFIGIRGSQSGAQRDPSA